MSSASPDRRHIAILGGTGPEGRGLALRLASVGHRVTIGSRSAARAMGIAADLRRSLPEGRLEGASNLDAASGADLIVLTIPFTGVESTLTEVRAAAAAKIVISAIAPVEFQDGRPVAMRVEAGSAAQRVAELLPESRVVSAFQTVDAHELGDLDRTLDTDIIVCSDDQEARRAVVGLISQIPGVRPLSGGRLVASRYVEEITALLITLNRIYKVHSGVRFTGINR